MPTTIDHFDKLTDLGLKVIPLRENSKVPMCKGWNVNWDQKAARERLERFPDANIGLLLGDVIDVEGDSEEANNVILKLVRNYPHPSYQSIRSTHHLFRTPDPKLRIMKVGEIEFRGHGHQSVLPPSSHYGFQYHWKRNFKFPIPEMPEPLLLFFKRHMYGSSRPEHKPGHLRTWCAKCERKVWINQKRHDLETEAFRMFEQRWMCRDCRSFDVRRICRMIKSKAPRHQILVNCAEPF